MIERVWRLRKHHTWIDARLQEGDAPAPPGSTVGVVLTCYYDGEPIYARRWPTRDLALNDADARLKELLRAGWATHW
jgi:hypothetical protein